MLENQKEDGGDSGGGQGKEVSERQITQERGRVPIFF